MSTVTLNSLYDTDFYAWTQEQAQLIQNRVFEKIDFQHLQEELYSMGNCEKRELGSQSSVLLMHLLKWKYQSSKQSKSWIRTIKNQRDDVKDVVKANPSLKYNLDEYFKTAYQKAVRNAAEETELEEEVFPPVCEWTIEQMLDDDFFP